MAPGAHLGTARSSGGQRGDQDVVLCETPLEVRQPGLKIQDPGGLLGQNGVQPGDVVVELVSGLVGFHQQLHLLQRGKEREEEMIHTGGG